MTTLDRLRVRLRAFRDKSYVRVLSGVAPFFVVNEFPKCGGTWLSQMLASAMELPFRRGEPIRFEPAVTHGHFLHPAGLRNVVVLWRDPRDMLVSLYHHCFLIEELGNGLMVRLMRERARFADFDDVRANMPAFIRLLAKNPVSPRFSWPQFAEVWANRPGTVQTRYEDLRRDAAAELDRVAAKLTGMPLPNGRAAAAAAEFAFERAKAKAEAERNASGVGGTPFVREGSVGGWHQYFSREAEAAIDMCGYREGMHRLGYGEWVADPIHETMD